MYKPIRRAELILGGTAIKQGEIFTLGFQLFDADGIVLVPTVGQTITVKIANTTGVVFETVASVVSDHIEFTVAENIGAGKMRVELTVADGANVLQKYPANGYIELYITASLDDIGTGTIYTVTAAEMFARIEGSETASAEAVATAGEAVVIAGNAVTTANAVRSDFDLVVAEAGSSNPEVVLARGEFANLGERLNDTNQQLAEMETNPSFKSELSDSAQLGSELVTSSGWTLGTGWSGSLETGFVHSLGQTLPLSLAISGLGYKYYQIEVTIVSPSSTKASNSGFTISIGDSVVFEMYEGNYTTRTYKRGIQANNGASFVIKPETGFDGTVTNVSIKEIISTVLPSATLLDANAVVALEFKPTDATKNNVFIGKSNALYATTANQNVAIGVKAGESITSAFWNVFIGYEAGMGAEVASRNVFIGYITGKKNKNGHRNNVLGSFAFHDNVDGHNNQVMGADAMQRNVSGSYNIVFGTTAMSESLTGTHNFAAGLGSQGLGTNNHHNVSIGNGSLASLNNSLARSIAIGQHTLRFATTGDNIAIGDLAGNAITTGTDNVLIGRNAGSSNVTGERNIIIGNYSGGTSSTRRNLIIGGGSGASMQAGADYNVIIGHASGSNITTGNNNVLIGYNVQAPSATDVHHLNIGNLLYGWMSASKKQIGINVVNPSARLHLAAGTTSAGTAPIKIVTGALMTTPENGAIEFDGTNLFLTSSTGVRKQIALV